ncbi:hypothetical protein Micbo1qcDRAFT_197357 [Microdochium bolleyi]|uniref:Uncharacterized protein n=1 Tax=Microdochium bolleyi TaxID=196109 RepID=A0A136IUK4_9PEZI|nr:hypothetical protein Micbo1qcDRAFT_197357 [Microdochium bolleyi]
MHVLFTTSSDFTTSIHSGPTTPKEATSWSDIPDSRGAKVSPASRGSRPLAPTARRRTIPLPSSRVVLDLFASLERGRMHCETTCSQPAPPTSHVEAHPHALPWVFHAVEPVDMLRNGHVPIYAPGFAKKFFAFSTAAACPSGAWAGVATQPHQYNSYLLAPRDRQDRSRLVPDAQSVVTACVRNDTFTPWATDRPDRLTRLPLDCILLPHKIALSLRHWNGRLLHRQLRTHALAACREPNAAMKALS